MATNPLAGINGTISTEELRTMGIETMLLAVQSNKASLLEELLKDQMLTLQSKNDQVASFNTLMANLNGLLSKFGKDATSTTTITLSTAETRDLTDAMTAAGVTSTSLFGTASTPGTPNKSQIDTAITKIKSNIDNLSNTQQMDMLRVQSISNKRNEAFEMMTTFIKKFNDMISAIIRNMG